ncbi:MAG: galactokinase family protein [Solirubrobacteraceae bacterium]
MLSAFGPGRVNLIGEHTDYNGGLALPFAIAEGVTVKAATIAGDQVEALALDLDEEDSFEVAQPVRAEGWRAFVRGAVAELRDAGITPPSAHLEISGNVPLGAGLSSSAALEVALTLALIALAGARRPDRLALAKLCSRIENDWTGAQTGLLDQIASLYGRTGQALRIDFNSLEVREVPLVLGEHKLVTLDSGERHAHATSGYNQRRDECTRACELLAVASLSQASSEAVAQLPDLLRRRASHVLGENVRVEQAVVALERGDMQALGLLLDASHRSLRDLYEVSTPAVERTVATLRGAGALGARIVGGGFGGHVLALMPPEARLPDGAREVRPSGEARVLD